MSRIRPPGVRSPADRAAFLRAVPLLRDLPARVIEEIARLAVPRPIARGEFLFLEGEVASRLFILVEGTIKLVRESEDGRQVILRIVRPAELFAAAGVWGESAYPATALAHRDSLVLALPVDGFREIVAGSPELAMAIIRLLAARLREAEARIRDLQNEQVEQRIARVLLRLVGKTGVKTPEGIAIGIPLTRQDLAELAGTTLSTVSRTLSAWSQQGLVITGRERVILRQPHRIVEIANGTASRGVPALPSELG
ncbi:MAG: Crp/Fnr family transcriptional regulator [Chloroflexi bacterium]|nr:Crp/Fnr family transcriptional regulator [Chloroflexota bacterium]